MAHTNGHHPDPGAPPQPRNEQEAERQLVGLPLTLGYRPSYPLLLATESNGRFPSYQMLQDVPQMIVHPAVKSPLEYYKSGIANCTFKIKAETAEQAQFVHDTLTRFWENDLDIAQQSWDFGWGGLEVLYRHKKGLLHFDQLADLHPLDCWALTRNGLYVGFAVKGLMGAGLSVSIPAGGLRLHGPGRWPAKGLWLTHNRYFHRFYGRSQLLGAWMPWRRLATRDGAEDVTDGANYRYGVGGTIIWYPPEDFKKKGSAPGSDVDYDAARDRAQAMAEQIKAGYGAAFPSTTRQDGSKKWDIQQPSGVLDTSPLAEREKDLAKQISKGIGVPPELEEASETGSGWSGRKVPLLGFYVGQQKNARSMTRQFVKQVVLPLGRWNYGPEFWCEVEVEVDLPAALKDQPKEQAQGGGPGEKPPPGGGDQPQKPPEKTEGMGDLTGLLGGGSSGRKQPSGGWELSTHAPAGGVTVAGQHFKGGEFIPDATLARATPQERSTLEKASRAQAGVTGKQQSAPPNQPARPQPPADQPAILSKIGKDVRDRDLNDVMRELSGVEMGFRVSDLPSGVAQQFDAHGTPDLKSLAALLNGGVDPRREFYSEQLGAERGAKLLRDSSPFLLLGHPGKTLKEGGVGGVLVDPLHTPNLPDLKRAFPWVKFVASQAAAQILPKVAPPGGKAVNYGRTLSAAPDDHTSLPDEPPTEPADPLEPDGVLDEVLTAVRRLSRAARADLLARIAKVTPDRALAVAQEWAAKWQPEIAELLTDARLAAVLESMRALAAKAGAAGAAVAPSPDVPMTGQPPTPEEGRLPLIAAAVADLRRRRILGVADYDGLRQRAGVEATLTAGKEVEAAVEKVRGALIKSVEAGSTPKAFREDVAGVLKEGTVLDPRHSETVFRANVHAAYSAGQERLLDDPAVGELFPFAEYFSIHDDRVRPEHRSMERRGIQGTAIYLREDPVWALYRPPFDWGCRCGWRPVSIREAARKGIDYAKEWLEKGFKPPSPPFVAMPPFRPDGSFVRDGMELSTDAEGHEHGGDGKFVSAGHGGKDATPPKEHRQTREDRVALERGREDSRIGRQREREDRDIQRQRDREDGKKLDARGREEDREWAKIERALEKSLDDLPTGADGNWTPEAERKAAELHRNADALMAEWNESQAKKWSAEDAEIKSKRKADDEERQHKRDAEDREILDRRDEEDAVFDDEDDEDEDDNLELSSAWDESKHSRDHGRFASKPGAGGEQQPAGKPRNRSEEKRQAVTQDLKRHVEHAVWQAALAGGKAGQAVREGASRIFRRLKLAAGRELSPKARKRLRTFARGCAAVEHKVMLGFTKARELAEQVTVEHGASPETAKRVARVLATVDVIASWTVNMPVAHAVAAPLGPVGALAASKVSGFLPVASMAFIAGATVKDPLATLRAARKVLARKHGEAAGTHLSTEADAGEPLDLLVYFLTAAEQAGKLDMAEALLAAAIDQQKGEVDLATAVANARGAMEGGEGDDLELASTDDQPGEWITIGGKPDDEGHKHVGGFRVKVGSDGTILAGGPRGLRGKKVSEAGAYFKEEHGKEGGEGKPEESEGAGDEPHKITTSKHPTWGTMHHVGGKDFVNRKDAEEHLKDLETGRGPNDAEWWTNASHEARMAWASRNVPGWLGMGMPAQNDWFRTANNDAFQKWQQIKAQRELDAAAAKKAEREAAEKTRKEGSKALASYKPKGKYEMKEIASPDSGGSEPIKVQGLTDGKLFAQKDGARWKIGHAPSGLLLGVDADNKGAALALMDRLNGMHDWSRSAEDLGKTEGLARRIQGEKEQMLREAAGQGQGGTEEKQSVAPEPQAGPFTASHPSETTAARQMSDYLAKRVDMDAIERSGSSNPLDGVGNHGAQAVFPIDGKLYVVDRKKDRSRYVESLREVPAKDVKFHNPKGGVQRAGVGSLPGLGHESSPSADHSTLARAFASHAHARHNLVSLADLKAATGWDNARLHSALRDLQKHGVLSLTGLEGRHGVSQRDRDAAIREGGGMLGYASVRDEDEAQAAWKKLAGGK